MKGFNMTRPESKKTEPFRSEPKRMPFDFWPIVINMADGSVRSATFSEALQYARKNRTRVYYHEQT